MKPYCAVAECDEKHIRLSRNVENSTEIVSVSFPDVISVLGSTDSVIVPSMDAVMNAAGKHVSIIDMQQLESGSDCFIVRDHFQPANQKRCCLVMESKDISLFIDALRKHL